MIDTRLRGIPFVVHDATDLLSNAIRKAGDFWEADILDYIRDNFPVQRIIVDVGANIGNHTLYFATYLEYDKIIAFEPSTENFALLKQNTEKFDQRKVFLYPQGLSDKDGWVTLMLNDMNSGANEMTYDEHPKTAFERVYVNTLDQAAKWFYPKAVSLLKIDVEWWEPQVIAGAQKTIERDHPIILIEDTQKKYGDLLPQYEMIKAWDHHSTYLYKWRE